MALVRWNPWGDLLSLHSQMDQLFGQTMGEFGMDGGEYANLPVDIRQTDGAFTIEASVPGFKPEDVEVTFDNGMLTIKGQAERKSESEKDGWVRRERRHTSVFRQVALPNEVKSDDITARFENGVLTITVPRVEKAQPKRIPVSGGNPSVVDAPKS